MRGIYLKIIIKPYLYLRCLYNNYNIIASLCVYGWTKSVNWRLRIRNLNLGRFFFKIFTRLIFLQMAPLLCTVHATTGATKHCSFWSSTALTLGFSMAKVVPPFTGPPPVLIWSVLRYLTALFYFLKKHWKSSQIHGPKLVLSALSCSVSSVINQSDLLPTCIWWMVSNL